MSLKAWALLGAAWLLAGCGYKEPALSEPHGILHAMGQLKIMAVDGESVMSTFEDELRVAPGSRLLKLNYSNNRETPAEGTDSPFARMPLDVKEGMKYHLRAEFVYGKESMLPGLKIDAVTMWRPVLVKEAPIRDYRSNPEAGTAADASSGDAPEIGAPDSQP